MSARPFTLYAQAIAWLFTAFTALTAASACTTATYGVPDLPQAWQGAAHVERLMQSQCGATPGQGPAEAVSATASMGDITLAYDNAPFRCFQDVEAYLRVHDSSVDVLVQPINLNPPLITTNCQCQYNLSLILPATKREHFPTGHYQINVFRRWDNINHPNDPVSVGQAAVNVP